MVKPQHPEDNTFMTHVAMSAVAWGMAHDKQPTAVAISEAQWRTMLAQIGIFKKMPPPTEMWGMNLIITEEDGPHFFA
jgi:hypothetical protein